MGASLKITFFTILFTSFLRADPAPEYPLPYRAPSAKEIAQVLDRVRNRLDAGSPARLSENGTLDRGPEGKFAQISYPMGVIHAGMLLAADATGDKRFADFTAKHFEVIATNLPKYADDSSRRNPFHSILHPGSLDACGAMGAAIIKARRANIGPDLKPTIDRFADYVSHRQFRLDDGTLARKNPQPNSVWGDDMYMSVPLLAQMGKLTDEKRYYDDAAKQVLQMSHRLFVPEKGLFTHGWNAENPDDHPRYFWGRANGWCMMAMVELLDVLPEDHTARSQIISILKAHAKGIATCQSGNGMWHQMLDRDDSYLETSCTAMFTFAIARAVNRGYLSAAEYGPVAVTGWNGVVSKVSPEGKLEGVCIGTNYGDDYVYYYHRPATDDIHGYGPVLLAGAEMLRLVQNPNIKIDSPEKNTIHFSATK